MKNLLITVFVALALAPLLALSAFADDLSFGIEQASVIIADAGEEEPTYGPGQNIVLNDRGKYLEINVVYTTGQITEEVGIGYKWSNDSGITWSGRRILTTGDYNRYGAHMAVGRTGAENFGWHFLWAGSSSSSSATYGKIYHMSYTGKPKAINSPNVVAYYRGRSIVADNKGGVHVIYAGLKDGKEQGIYYTGSSDSGASFNIHETIGVCEDKCGFEEPVITVNEKGQLIAVYQDSKDPKAGVRFAWRDEDKWNSTSIPNGGFGTPKFQSISSNGGMTCIAWGTSNPAAVVASCSTDYGKTWDSRKITDSIPYERPNIAVDVSGIPSIVWTEISGNHSAMYFSRFSSGKWSHPKVIVSENSFLSDPKMALGPDGKAYIVFSQDGQSSFNLKFIKEK